MNYSFGVPTLLIWLFHIALGLTLLYIGYQLVNGLPLNKNLALLLIIIGVLGALYHAHLWYFYSQGPFPCKTINDPLPS